MNPVPRRSVTILAMDAAGYSRAMSRDETRALAALGTSREIIDGLVAEHGGRIFSTAGDSVLAEFPRATPAVRAAIAVQEALAAARAAGTEILTYRIGLHAGRVHAVGVDLLGEAVNIAARLESIAPPGGICVSEEVLGALDGSLSLDLVEMGARVLKGILAPVRVARIRLGEAEPPASVASRLSLAVLPFRAPPADVHWGEGLAEDLIAALSRFASLAVLGHDASFPLRETEDPRLVAADLGVGYVVTGSIRLQADRFRLSVRLLDGASGAVLWADRQDGAAEALMALQDALVEKIVGNLVGRVEQVAGETALRRRAETLGAFDLLLRGQRHADRLDPASARHAVDCYERALGLEPDLPAALASVALMRLRLWSFDPVPGGLDRAVREAEQALALDPADGWCHLVLGQLAMYRGQLDAAEVHHKKAQALNPFDARIPALWSPLAVYLGRPEEGRSLAERAMSLNPHHPAWYTTNLGLARYAARDYAEAAAVYASIPGAQTGALAVLVASRAQLGDAAGAAEARARLLAVRPDFSAEAFVRLRPFKHAFDREHLLEGLRKGGL